MLKAKTAFKQRAQLYYRLSKPGIIYGNIITVVAGYMYASEFKVDLIIFLGLILGLSLVIAGACATNNYLDRGLDAKMQRTKGRSLVNGDLSPRQALIFAAITTTSGVVLLTITQNALTLALGVSGWLAYVVLYGYAKRTSAHGTLVGTISGSIPLVAGYTAVGGALTITAWQLFVLMAAWQMAHFYGIALYRQVDYKKAGLPIMPIVYGAMSTQLQTMGYIVIFLAAVLWMLRTSNLTVIAAAAMSALAVIWLTKAVIAFRAASEAAWGRKVFLFSLIVMLGMSAALVANPLLPL